MYLQLLAELIPILNKCFSHHQTLAAIGHYHTIYLIVELLQINLMFNGLKIILSLLDLSLTSLQLLQEFLTSLLLPKYHNKTNVVLNTANFGVYFYPQPSKEFSPLITQQSFTQQPLLKKRTNPTPYSPITHFKKENNPPTHQAHSSFPMKSLKALNNLTPLK
jgi:hypothetical protein